MAIDPTAFGVDGFDFPAGATPAAGATPGEVLAARLFATSAVTALVGTRIYPTKPEQDPQGDYAVYYRTGGGGGVRLAAPTRLNRYTIRVDCYSTTAAGAEAILAAAAAALSGWSDRTNRVQGCFAEEDADELLADDGGGSPYQVSGQTFALWYLR